jgi:DNA-binding PadR family transcriptional regulator
MSRIFQRSPLALAILVLLYEAPMHPYRMQQLIKERGKDIVINVQRRASLYQTIRQLLRAELITVRETERQQKRPERTVYALTAKGEQTAEKWLREALSTLNEEFPEFPAAVSFMPVLSVADALQQLELREGKLAAKLAQVEEMIHQAAPTISRLFLLEEEYLVEVLNAELKWVRSLIDDLRAGRVTWDREWRQQSEPMQSDDKNA